jgi:phage-related protein
MMSRWSVELEPDVRQWLESLPARAFAIAAVNVDRLADQGARLRMPHSRNLGGGLHELRFDLDHVAVRVTYLLPGDHRTVLLTQFRKQRDNERQEVARAQRALQRCVAERHDAEETEV